MSAEPAPLAPAVSPWAGRRRRAEALRARHPFAAELMTLYLALLPVQEDAWAAARDGAPATDELPRWASGGVLPAVVDAAVRAGPATLAQAASGRLGTDAAERTLAGWLAGARLDPVDRYLARATLAPVLEALGERAGAACGPECPGEAGERCPRCGGLPQLSIIASSGEELVSGPRSLLCSRCGTGWQFSRSTCPACGERREDRLMVYAEELSGAVSGPGANGNGAPPVFPHLRIAGCTTCSRYLIEVDMARDERAVPEVDELTALPLDLHATDQGLTKVTPNLMGF
jgi:Protein involved in formate dehydrogenase formation